MTDKNDDIIASRMNDDLLDDQDKEPLKLDFGIFAKRVEVHASLEIPDFLRRVDPVAAAKDTVAMDIKVVEDDGVAKISMADAEDMAKRMRHYLAEYMELHDILWTDEAGDEFLFACMKGLAKCKWRGPEGNYKQIIITADQIGGK